MTKSEMEVLLEFLQDNPVLRPTMSHPKNTDMIYVITGTIKVTNHEGEWEELIMYRNEASKVLYARPIECFYKFKYLGTFNPYGTKVH